MDSPSATGVFRITSAGGETVCAFVPAPLPPNLCLEPEDYDQMERANRALGRLDGISAMLPDRELFRTLSLRTEAVLSSQMEGTSSSLSDLLLSEPEPPSGVPASDAEAISNYVAAVDHGLQKLRDGGALSLSLIREIHGVLVGEGETSPPTPSAFRTTQVWMGGSRPSTARFVPPPANEVPGCLDRLERFVQTPGAPVLIKAALVHAQFATIHPFVDGTGRLGRILVPLILCAEGALTDPVLTLSGYLKANQAAYDEHLQRIRTHGEWEAWLRFVLRGVEETATQAVDTARDVLALFERDRERIRTTARGAASSTLRVHEAMKRHPRVSIKDAARWSGVSQPTAKGALERMAGLGIAREVTGGSYRMTFLYEPYLALLTRALEPAPAPRRD